MILQVWKIEVPSAAANSLSIHGWALAHTADEAKSLSGFKNAIIQQKPEHIWVARERVVWENQLTG
ncbi:hypothetical protein [Yoonia sp. MH D7]